MLLRISFQNAKSNIEVYVIAKKKLNLAFKNSVYFCYLIQLDKIFQYKF